MRAAGLVLLVLLPFAPTYPAAMLLYGSRLVMNRGTAGPRQALALGLVPPARRGLAASVNGFSMQLPRALGPAFTGLLFAAGSFAAPFLLAALLQGAYLALFPRVFGGQDPEQPLVRPRAGR
jgi:predicted MFS family arabinose efflux permease